MLLYHLKAFSNEVQDIEVKARKYDVLLSNPKRRTQLLRQALCGVSTFSPNNRQLGTRGSLSTQLLARGAAGTGVWTGFLFGARQWGPTLPTEFF